MTPPLPVRRLHPDARVPVRAHPWDAGLDLACTRAVTVPARGRAEAGTGLGIAVPEGWGGLVMPRSGLARKHGVTVTNAPGLIDAGYRGEVIVLLVNHGDEDVVLEAGSRVAQLVLVPVWAGDAVEVDVLPGSDSRGEGGFGSSGTS
ncbi:MAG: dUTP diphosphatase [Thermoleophilia bacterium]|nr:dUTP diphosphatase [Thermoleophilia bacterium]